MMKHSEILSLASLDDFSSIRGISFWTPQTEEIFSSPVLFLNFGYHAIELEGIQCSALLKENVVINDPASKSGQPLGQVRPRMDLACSKYNGQIWPYSAQNCPATRVRHKLPRQVIC